jgi:2-oxo-4-hydroxy-4-carboxy-5-ureidoimidazoline decarboxylase
MTLYDLNMLPKAQLRQELLKCCGSSAWVEKVMNFFPIEDLVELLDDAEEEWYKCSQEDWKEAFSHHPKIGDIDSLKRKFASTANWAMGEQSGTSTASEETIKALAKGNEEYEDKFGYIFIVCATGKSADEMLTVLKSRLFNDPEKEIKIAADEQNKITRLRLEKLLDK